MLAKRSASVVDQPEIQVAENPTPVWLQFITDYELPRLHTGQALLCSAQAHIPSKKHGWAWKEFQPALASVKLANLPSAHTALFELIPCATEVYDLGCRQLLAAVSTW